MSLPTSSTTRTPLKDVSSSLPYNSKTGTPRLQPLKPTGSTPKTSPGPALLHGIRLSAKKNLLKVGVPVLNTANTTNGVMTKLPNSTQKSEASERVLPFRRLLSSETARISKICCHWDIILQDIAGTEPAKVDVPGDFVLGEIRSTIGQARLIMKERFHQFEGLVDNCEFQTSEKTVTCEDLQGFWDMIYFQVEDVDKKFAVLKNCQSNNWSESSLQPEKDPSPVKKVMKKAPIKKKSQAKSAAAKARSEEMAKKRTEARKRLQAAKAEMKKAHNQADQKTFDAGPFFKIESPVKSPRKKVDFVNISFEYSANKPTTIADPPKSSSESMPETACVDAAQLPSEFTKPVVPINESPVRKCEEALSSDFRSAVEEIDHRKSPDKRQNITTRTTTDKATPMLCAVDASGDGVPTICASDTLKNISRLSILSATVSPWSDTSIPEVEHKTTPLCRDPNMVNGEKSLTGNRNFVDTPARDKSFSSLMENLMLSDAAPQTQLDKSLPEVFAEAANVTEMQPLLISPPATCTGSQVNGDVEQVIRTPYTPVGKDGVDVSVLIDTAAKNIEMASELLNETPQRHPRIRSLVDQETNFTPQDAKSEKCMAEALQNILKHMAVFQDLSEHHLANNRPTKDQTDTMIKEMQDEIESLKIKNANLQRKTEEPLTCDHVVKYLYDTTEMPETEDILFKPHYLRLLAKVKMLQIEMSQYEKCAELLDEKSTHLQTLVNRLNLRKMEIGKKESEVKEREAKCQEIEIAENEEFLRNKADLENLKKEVAEREELMINMATQIEQQVPVIKELKERNEFLEIESYNLKQDHTEQANDLKTLHAELDKLRNMHRSEFDRANELQRQFDMMNKEVYSTFKEFEDVLEEKNKAAARQEEKLKELISENVNFRETRRKLEDRVETLEYVEEEMKTLQEQLTETENILASSKLNEEKANQSLVELKDVLTQCDSEIANLQENCTLLQERCDVVQTEADFMVQKSKEELLDGIVGVDHIVKEMRSFLSRLKDATEASSVNAIDKIQSDSPTCFPSQVVKNEDSMSWKVDQANSLFSSIVKECSELNVKFRKDIERLEGEKLAFKKQIEDVRTSVLDGARKDNELEALLRKRITSLSKERDEKLLKLEGQVRAMKILSDQNVELLEYKMKHQGMLAGSRGCGRRSISKRRSLSSDR